MHVRVFVCVCGASVYACVCVTVRCVYLMPLGSQQSTYVCLRVEGTRLGLIKYH